VPEREGKEGVIRGFGEFQKGGEEVQKRNVIFDFWFERKNRK